jgi:hypothetical protein
MDETIDKERLAIHEAGHTVLAKFFEDCLYLNEMKIIPDAGTAEWTRLGRTDIKGKDNAQGPFLGIIALGGIVGEGKVLVTPCLGIPHLKG